MIPLYQIDTKAKIVRKVDVEPIDAHDAVRRFPEEYFLSEPKAPAGFSFVDASVPNVVVEALPAETPPAPPDPVVIPAPAPDLAPDTTPAPTAKK